ncbi:SusC/RagA family TonB-linked outer membrane protein [Fulvivirga maritima]|uniref:SusC/RagA family TonB-linked outer membrane protein n=1 Tax=Fulvivirga maritima TaxID=2904247 RepID=UPI001F25C0FC|nr:SusC/RagA family TonB-linked outer membrane protein [Fulvivirga maritima]UII27180.1 SusC/RagA family TonB-linked outer membrane protein [Fulvivirga maritima]
MKKLKYDQIYAWSVLSMIMKIWLFILISAGVALAGTVKSQNLNINLKNVTVRKALNVLEKESDYSFFYNDSFADLDKRVSISAENEELNAVLTKLLSNTGLTFKFLDGNLIVISPKNPIEPIAVSGVVSSAVDGEVLPGVSITIKGTTKGTITDFEGKYSIKVDPEASLIYSFIGYVDQEIAVNNRSAIDVQLEEDITTLNEVMVISTGYQEIDKRLFTGSVVKLEAEEIKTEGTIDVGRMLQGRAAGVSVQNVSGTFGTAPKIRVRGATSITGDNKPLWVIDGVVLEDIVNVSPDQLTTGDPSTLIGSSVAGINSEDIESINILKDASATALYGARAKDGVVIITTKKGRIGKPLVTYAGNFSSYLKPSYNSYNIMNSSDQMSVYAELERKGYLNHSDISRSANGGMYKKMYDLINNSFDENTGQFALENTPEARRAFLNRYATANTDWFDELFKNSFVQEHSLGISSGTESSKLYFSTSYYNDQGWTIADRVKRYTANARGTFNLSDKLSVGFITTGSVRDQRVPGTVDRQTNTVSGGYSRDFDINPFSYALNTSRALTAYDENGDLEYFTRNYAPFNIINELDKNYIDLYVQDFKLQGELNYKILKGLNYDFVAAVRSVKTTTEHKVEEGSNMAEAYRADESQVIRQGNKFLYYNPDYPNMDPVVVLPEGGFYNRSDDQMVSYYVKNQLGWNHLFNDQHNVNLVLGQEIRQIDRQNAYSNGYGYQYGKGGVPFTDYQIIRQQLEQNFNYFGMQNAYERYASFYAGLTYSYKGKYVFNSTVRYDGSNRLGESTTARWLPTWNVSGAWNIDTEDFMKDIEAFDFLTLKVGYGLTANIGNATNSSAVYRSGTTRRPYLDETEAVIGIESLVNSDLTWEKQYETNIGINAGLFKRLNFSFDYYRRNHFDLISLIKTSGIGGEAYKYVNYADMKSHGVDLTLGATVFERRDWAWNANFIFSYNKNKITNLKNLPRIVDLIFPEGGAQQGFPVRGLFSIDFEGLDSETGVPLFVNQDGEVSPNVFMQSYETAYLKYEGPVDPTVTGGLSNTFRYKDFSLNLFFTYQAGNKIRLNPAFSSTYSDLNASPREFHDRWILPGDEERTNVPSIADLMTLNELYATGEVYPYNSYNYSTERVADGSYIRLRTVSLTYNLPRKWLTDLSLQTASFSLTGTNLFLLYADKRLYGQDPEFFASGGVAMPVAKQITASLKLSF